MNTNSSKSFGQLFIRNKRRLYDINAQHYQKPVLGIGKVIFRRILRFKYDHQKTKPHCYQLRKNKCKTLDVFIPVDNVKRGMNKMDKYQDLARENWKL